MRAGGSSVRVSTRGDDEAPSRGWFGAAVGVVSLLVFGVGGGLGLLVSWAALMLPSKPTEYDISGFGICNGSHIHVERLWSWTQSPTPLHIEEVEASSIGDAFRFYQGKNAVVWTNAADLAGFTYDTHGVDANHITTNELVSTTGATMCHFTIDAQGNYNDWSGLDFDR